MREKRSALVLGGLALAATACSHSSGSSGGFGLSVAPATSGTAVSPVTTGTTAPAAPVRQAPANLHTGPELVLVTSATAAFFEAPFPSDARLLPNGSPDFSGLPNPRNASFVRAAIEVAQTDVKGFSPSGAMYVPFDGPINAPKDDPVASSQAGSPVFVVDVDPRSSHRLERRRVHFSLTTKNEQVRPANLLQILTPPGMPLRTNTTYAVVVLRSLGAPGTPWLGQTPVLTELLAGRGPAALQKAFAPLPAALRDLGIHPDDVAAATVFTTGDPADLVFRQVANVNARPAPPLHGKIEVRDDWPSFTALRGYYLPEQYQRGLIPYPLAPGGRQVQDGSGMPVVQARDKAEFQLSVPKGKMPARGFPLYFYVHGTGGLPSQAIDRGKWITDKQPSPPGEGVAKVLAPRGWATSCAAGPLSPSRIGFLSADGYAAYNFFNPAAMRDNFIQMLLEMVQFRKLVLELAIDPSLCPGTDASASPDGKIHFDPDHVVVAGQSLGSYLSGMLAATLPGFRGAVLSGAGGSWNEFAFGPKDPVDLRLLLEALALPFGERLDRFHPFIVPFDAAVGPADNTHYVYKVLREAPPGRNPPHVLVIEGHADIQVPDNLQRALILGMGVDLGGSDVGSGRDDTVAWVLPFGDRKQMPLPIKGNVVLPNGERRTAVVCRYERDAIKEGHYVIVQRDEPKRQLADFCEAIARDEIPEIR